jgi:predicted enzyme related to lactoylglutathione lyase
MNTVEFILYVSNQEKSTAFYQTILGIKPSLNVPGMTEFQLNTYCKLGLMPNEGIAKIITPNLPHPTTGNGIPRCELYLSETDLENKLSICKKAGAKLISSIEPRNWGDTVFYISDFDGHVIAFASKA